MLFPSKSSPPCTLLSFEPFSARRSLKKQSFPTEWPKANPCCTRTFAQLLRVRLQKTCRYLWYGSPRIILNERTQSSATLSLLLGYHWHSQMGTVKHRQAIDLEVAETNARFRPQMAQLIDQLSAVGVT
ncbi:MAG: hypothetical protein JWM44_2172 [Bacilli bacterium]|nr:hypothetical protein [Bacilli bacterium]